MPALILAILWLTAPSAAAITPGISSGEVHTLDTTGGGDTADPSGPAGPICIPFIGCF